MDNSVVLAQDKREDILRCVDILIKYHKDGTLGGAVMPEDANPGLLKNSDESYLYFTLPMALNYQRNSYKLWESVLSTYMDTETIDIFYPNLVVKMSIDQLRMKLVKYLVAVQPNKQTEIWMELCKTFSNDFNGSVKEFFVNNDFSVKHIKEYMLSHKKQFPYLSGTKIMNYWLYVMEQYTDAHFVDRENISVAPDTHVLQASAKLGLISNDDVNTFGIQDRVSKLWMAVFDGTDKCSIDIHTPLWLWSRGGFYAKVGVYGGELSESRMQFHF